MDDKVKLAGLLLGGYLLGRTKKMRLALMIAAGIAGKRLKDESQGAGLLGGLGGLRDSVLSSPEIKRLQGEVTGKLVGAGKAAALAAANRRIDSLSSTIQDQTERLRAMQPPSAPEPGEEPEEEPAEDVTEEPAEEEPEAEAEEEPEAEAEEEPEEERKPPARSRSTRKKAGDTGGGTDTTAKSARAPAKKPAAPRQRRASGSRKSS